MVPYDSKRRGPEERAAMLEKLGISKLVYDYRKEHIPQWDAELAALAKHHIELLGWWFPGNLNDEAKAALELFKQYGVKPQLWVSGGGGPIAVKDEADQRARIAVELARLKPICAAAREIGCTVGLYNHGNWFGEPENQLAIIEALKADGVTNVGIVYNFHHGHGQLDRIVRILARTLPHLLCVNLNGMDVGGDEKGRKILPLGVGTEDLRILHQLRESGYKGPVGILNHTNEDAEGRLLDNLDGLNWLLPQLDG
ncbi:MAG: sugar phosphate isomerase/epimerase, partial [Proteobacteria bacterium]|nr:sugar phosphate isomerase/epimerase [Pseudomonadota bacterium]